MIKQLYCCGTLLLFFAASFSQTKRSDQPWQLDVAAGVHSFYAPIQHIKWKRPELIAQAGLHKLIGKQQQFSVGLQFQLARNNYHGDAVSLQLIGQYTPVIAETIELGIGTGIGYRLSLYGTKPLKWDGTNWVTGRAWKGVIQVPLQVSAGYRSMRLLNYELRPYLACQMQALFRYSPDFSPLPVTNLLVGLKIHNYKK